MKLFMKDLRNTYVWVRGDQADLLWRRMLNAVATVCRYPFWIGFAVVGGVIFNMHSKFTGASRCCAEECHRWDATPRISITLVSCMGETRLIGAATQTPDRINLMT
jgi:hypothetical protein